MGAIERQVAMLSVLERANLCTMPSSISFLQPYQKDAIVPAINTIQQQFVRPTLDVAEAQRVYGPSSLSIPQNSAQIELGVELSITQAPASFAVPQLPQTPFSVPFRVSLRLASTIPTALEATMRVNVLNPRDVATAGYWAPAEQDSRLSGAEVSGQMQLFESTSALHDGRMVYSAASDFLFETLQFTEPSNCEPVFLAFYLILPGSHKTQLFAIFLMPTVVCTPGSLTEHQSAMKLLWHWDHDRLVLPRWSFQEFCSYINQELQFSLSLTREISPLDVLMLAERAGFYLFTEGEDRADGSGGGGSGSGSGGSGSSGGGGGGSVPRIAGGPTTQEEIDSIHVYVQRTQALLKLLKHHYERDDPQIICGFAVGREEAESVLIQHPPGTFILRFSTEPGALVLSSVVADGSIHHMKYSLASLQMVSLEEALALCQGVDVLLDIATGKKYPRTLVLDRGYHMDPRLQKLVMVRSGGSYADGGRPTASQAESTGGHGGRNYGGSGGGGDGDEIMMETTPQEEGDQIPDQGFGTYFKSPPTSAVGGGGSMSGVTAGVSGGVSGVGVGLGVVLHESGGDSHLAENSKAKAASGEGESGGGVGGSGGGGGEGPTIEEDIAIYRAFLAARSAGGTGMGGGGGGGPGAQTK